MKIFGIGFHKTGTTTLDVALQKLGYNVCGVKTGFAKHLFSNNMKRIYKEVDKYDAFQDNPWPLLYKELDERYPGSKFILTLRDEQKWLKSVVNHFGERPTEMRRWIYGIAYPKGHEDIYLARYQQHNREVIEYFKDRPDDLLVLSWENGDDWEKICKFLDKPIPGEPFPHANRGDYSGKQKEVAQSKKPWFKKLFG